MNIKSEDMLK